MIDPLSRRHLLHALLCAPMLARPAHARTRAYALTPRDATITFLFDLGGLTQSGTAPLGSADIRIDPGDLGASQADVTADLTEACTGLIFATQAMKSASVLDTDRFPTARFRSTRVTLGRSGRLSEGAALDGLLTLRGVTRPIRFDAALYRPQGSAPDDLSLLDIHLRGAIARAEFGADGYADLVADHVGLDIRARVRAL
jgi:polyisoprenoid-binding protein YceI